MKKILRNKKGFTLVELLAVIVVLAVVMLIASSGVGSAMTKARKSSLAIEGGYLVDAARTAYNLEILQPGFAESNSVCYTLQYLYEDGDYDKGKDQGYYGSVLVTKNASNSNILEYKFWISNGSFAYVNKEKGVAYDQAESSGEVSAYINCGGATTNIKKAKSE